MAIELTFVSSCCSTSSIFAMLYRMYLQKQRKYKHEMIELPFLVFSLLVSSCFHLSNLSLVHVGLIWSEVKQLWDVGLQEYVHDMWNVIDFITNSLYVATVALRVVSYFQVSK